MDTAQEIKLGAYNRIKKLRQSYKEDPQKNGERMRRGFLEMFHMFHGDIRERLKQSYARPNEFFSCNPTWPLCAFNFAKKHVIPEEFSFKSQDYEKISILRNYFSEDLLENQRAIEA